MKKIALSLFVLFSLAFTATAQDFIGYINSNYSGIIGTDLQPASVVDNRFQTDIHLIGFSASVFNNYVGMDKSALKHSGNFYSGHYAAFDDEKFGEHYLSARENGIDKSVYFTNQVYLPSFMFAINEKNALAFKWKVRTILNIDGIEEPLAKLIYNQLDYPSLWQQDIRNKNLSIQTMTWAEYGITYGHVLKAEGKHFLKAGATVKLLQGLQAAYLYVDDLYYNFRNDDTLSLFHTHVNYGHSTNFEFNQNNIKYKFVSNPSVGFDLGIVYEWRPNYEKFKYEMDGKTNLNRKDLNKYKLKVGISLLDVGSVKFQKAPESHDFTADISLWNIHNFDINNIKEFDDTVNYRFTDEGGQYFNMQLPTALTAQIDYNIWKDVYLNFTPYYSFFSKTSKSKVHEISTFSLTPRWDFKWAGIFIPVSYDLMGNTKIGFGFRLGPVIIGTSSLAPWVTNSKIYGGDIHLMLKLTMRHKQTKDKDNDHISDRLDRCVTIPGVLEFWGCPDKDGDHVQDSEDICPDEPGLVALRGCPDKDGDGITDKIDACPDIAGIAEFYGCPDKDGDKIPDKDDDCPDVAGLAEFKGCPDRDGDKVIDKNDDCPDKPGPASNNGCPETKLLLVDSQGNTLRSTIRRKDGTFYFDELPPDESVLFKLEGADADLLSEIKIMVGTVMKKAIRNGSDKFFRFIVLKTDVNTLGKENEKDVPIKLDLKEAAIVKKAFSNLEFLSGKDVIKTESFASLDELAGLLLKKTDWRLKVTGHTDNQGQAAANMKLSQKRAEALKKYLVSKGINENRFKVEWFGSKKPIADNKTPEGRQKNRRVEMLIIE